MPSESTESIGSITQLLQKAIDSRVALFDARHQAAFRLFNGFMEGNPHLSLDLYAGSVVFHNYHPDASVGMQLVHEAVPFVQNHPLLSEWLHAGIVKSRNSISQDDRRGKLVFGIS